MGRGNVRNKITNAVNATVNYLQGDSTAAKVIKATLGPVKPQKRNKRPGRSGSQGGNY